MCENCNGATPLVIGKTNDYGIAIKYPNTLIAYGYDVHGGGNNGLVTKINYCPMCGEKLIKSEDGIPETLRAITKHLNNILSSSSEDGDYNEGFCDGLEYVVNYIENM